MIEEYIPKFMDILYEDNIRDKVTFDEIRDAFHTNQIIGKNDAIIGFSKLPKTKFKNVLYIQPWFGILTRYLCEKYTTYLFSQIDYDNVHENVSKRFVLNNTNHIEYFNIDTSDFENFADYSTILNLSTEHMNEDWFNRLSDGTEVVMQCNNFEIDHHVNICNNIDEMKSKYPLSKIYYENTIELNVYNRFTLVGKK